MSQNCECAKPVVKVPVRGLELALDQEAFGGIGGNCCVDYSFEEQWTGRRWVDGKKIYQKTLDCGPLPISATKYVPIGVDTIENIINIFGISSAGDQIIALPHASTSANANVDCCAKQLPNEGWNIRLITAHTTRCLETYVTIRYTCTNR